MRAFTVYQPYAYAIVAGLKGYETRQRRTNIRGRVAVHAGKQKIALADMSVVLVPREGQSLRYGAVVGTVEIVDCVPVEDVVDGLTEQERVLGDYSPGALGLGPEKSGHVRYADSSTRKTRLVGMGRGIA